MTIQDRLSQFLRETRMRTTRQVVNDDAVGRRIKAIILNVLRRRFPISELPDGISFEDLCIDAFERVYIADEIEREWQIALADDEIEAWTKFDEVERSVRRRLQV